MHKVLGSFVIGLLMVINWSCTSSPEPLFIMQMESDFTMPAGLNNIDTHYFVLRGIPTFAGNYVNTDAGRDAVEQIVANRGEIVARFNQIDWAIVQEISIWAQAADDSSNKKEVFYQNQINFGNVSEIRLSASLPNVKDILLQDVVTFEVRVRLRTITPREIDTRLTMNFVAHGIQ